MAQDALESIKAAEEKACEIREKAKITAASMISSANEEARKAVADAEKAAGEYKMRTLGEISEKSEKIIEKNADETAYDASKVTNHAERMYDKAVEYIIGGISGRE